MRTSYNNSKTRSSLTTQKNEPPSVEFELNYNFPINYISFSQRRFLGFRNRYEFDKKRLVFGSDHEFSVVGYDHEKRVYELFHQKQTERIRFVSLLEDNTPNFLFLITENSEDQQTSFKILKLKKNEKYEDPNLTSSPQSGQRIEQTKDQIQKKILTGFKEGNFHQRHKKSYDNVELILKKGQALNRPNSHLKIQKTQSVNITMGDVEEKSRRNSMAFPDIKDLQDKGDGIKNDGVFRGLLSKIFTPKRT